MPSSYWLQGVAFYDHLPLSLSLPEIPENPSLFWIIVSYPLLAALHKILNLSGVGGVWLGPADSS